MMLNTIEEVIEDFRQGKMVIIMDDEDRENEGDLTMAELVKKFDVRLSDVEDEIAHLSGGNQQKAVVARELHRDPRFMLVNQPTRGIDIGAMEFVLQQILEHRDAGAAVLLVSTELEELFAVSDRILVMYQGTFTGHFDRHDAAEEPILACAMGQSIHLKP